MTKQEAWERFKESGLIKDYLAYKKLKDED